MAQNALPKNTGALLVLAGKCAAGLTTYGTALNITQITAAGLTGDAASLQATMGVFNASRAARTAATANHLRWFLAAPGQTGFVFVADSADGEIFLGGQPAGQTVQMRATAVNPAGESVPSFAIL